MENGKWKTENKKILRQYFSFFVFRFPFSVKSSVFICVHLWLIFLFSCASKPIDLRALAPAETLVYLETNDLAKTLNSLTDNKAFQELAKDKPDFSAFENVQVAVVVTGFEASEQKVTITSRKTENLQPMANLIRENGGECLAVAADVRDFAAVEKAISETVKQFGKIDIVINGAAGNFLCQAEELSSNGFGTIVDIDTKGTFNVCRAAFAELEKSKGQILNISATLHYTATNMQIHVSAAKAGVDAITRNLAVEWGRHGIRVNGIAPGPIADTEGFKRLLPEPLKEKLTTDAHR